MLDNRFKRGLKNFNSSNKSTKQLHNYCMENLGFKEVCEFMNIKYKNE